ncbi:MAG TPA: thiamine pyrophosphate-binding protein [Stellaceae bacterium]|nr:thiamine pyrophosphate-binding protein [Stellaceae bacterium]
MASVSEAMPVVAAPPRHAASISGAEQIARSFFRHGITHVYLFPGGTIAPIIEAVETRTRIAIVCPRNEQGAGYAALAHARLSGKPAVLMVTSGPGVTNAVTPIADAYYDNIPLVVLTGQVGTGDMRGSVPVKQRGFQEVDTIDLVKPIAKAAFLVKDARDLPEIMERAFFLAQSGRQGPVIVDLPMNVQRASVEADDDAPLRKRFDDTPKAPDEALLRLAHWIESASRPVILAGGGILAARAHAELRRLAEQRGIPVAMSLPGLGAMPSMSPLSLGLCGYAGSQHANLAIYNSDLLLAVGTTLHVRQTGSLPERTAPKAKIARIDIDRNELEHSRVPLDLALHSDAKTALGALNDLLMRPAIGAPRTQYWLAMIDAWRARFPLSVKRKTRRLKPQEVIAIADRVVRGKEVIVSTGVGQHQIWVPRHFAFDYPRRQLLTSSGHGTMGYDLPAAIGAKIARPKATVLCFVGDGSLQMNLQELGTIAELKLDIKIIVLDNQALSIVAQFQRQNWKSHPTTGDKRNPDFARIARAYGIRAVTVGTAASARKTIPAELKRRGPVLIHCRVDPKEELLPMLLGGHTLDDMSFETSF